MFTCTVQYLFLYINVSGWVILNFIQHTNFQGTMKTVLAVTYLWPEPKNVIAPHLEPHHFHATLLPSKLPGE
jgi:hypothetical protein